jgi:hypothetical protein
MTDRSHSEIQQGASASACMQQNHYQFQLLITFQTCCFTHKQLALAAVESVFSAFNIQQCTNKHLPHTHTMDFTTNHLPTSDEYLNVELDWDFDAVSSDCENLDYLSDNTSLMEPLIGFSLGPIEPTSTSEQHLPFLYTEQTVEPPYHCESSSEDSVKTVSDTSSTDQSYCSTSETSLESLDGQVSLQREDRPRPVKRMRKRAITTKRLGRKKPKDMPKRYLSAYNIFFQTERRRLFEDAEERIGFSDLGKLIGKRWRLLPDEEREQYEAKAEEDIGRYRHEMNIYENARRRKFSRSSTVSVDSSSSSRTMSPLPRPAPAVSQRRRVQQYSHPPPPMVYAVAPPVQIMPDHHYSHQGQGHYNNNCGYDQQQQQQQQHPYPQVQYACYRMTRTEAQDYMHRYGGGQQYMPGM